MTYWQCDMCEMIYETQTGARMCCQPQPRPVWESEIVMCIYCHGDGCKRCAERGIMLVREVLEREELRAALLEIKA